MNDQPDSPDERFEAMLRRWGAEEAARRTAPLERLVEAHNITLASAWRNLPLLRWVAAAVAAVLVVTVSLLLITGNPFRRTGPQGRDGQIAELRKAEADLTKAKQGLTEAAGLEKELSDAQKAGEAFSERLAQVQIASELDRSALSKEAIKLQKELSQERNDLEATRSALAIAQDSLTQAHSDQKKLQAEMDKLNQRFRAETARLREMREETLVKAREANIKLQTSRARESRAFSDFQQVYLSAAAPGQAGLVARQHAGRGSGLLFGASDIRKAAISETTKRLIDSLEVVLTRLDMLDATDISSLESFASLLADSGVLRRLEEVLTAGTEPIEIREWVLETKLILAGADRIG